MATKPLIPNDPVVFIKNIFLMTSCSKLEANILRKDLSIILYYYYYYYLLAGLEHPQDLNWQILKRNFLCKTGFEQKEIF